MKIKKALQVSKSFRRGDKFSKFDRRPSIYVSPYEERKQRKEEKHIFQDPLDDEIEEQEQHNSYEELE
jgi:hypothetical protein